LDHAAWKNAHATAELGVKLATAGGSYYAKPKRRLQLYSSIADYFDEPNGDALVNVRTTRKAIVADIDTAPSDEAGASLMPVYWEATTWAQAMQTHLSVLGRKLPPNTDLAADGTETIPFARYDRLFPKTGDCRVEAVWRKPPTYPSSSVYQGFVGA